MINSCASTNAVIRPQTYTKNRCTIDCAVDCTSSCTTYHGGSCTNYYANGCVNGSAKGYVAGFESCYCHGTTAIDDKAACANKGGGEGSYTCERGVTNDHMSTHQLVTRPLVYLDAVVNPLTPIDGYIDCQAASCADGCANGCHWLN